MALILNIDTATEVCSVCLSDNYKCLDIRESFEDRSHASLLTVFIEEILNSNNLKINDVNAVSISKGPGSYTGLRIGVSVAKGLCYAANKPLIAISTLQAMSYEVSSELSIEENKNILFVPMIDARRMEVYTAMFNIKNEMVNKIEAKIIDGNSYMKQLTDNIIYFFGSGALKCKKEIIHENAIFLEDYQHSSQYMIKLAELAYSEKKFENVAYFEPYYLKDFITTIPKKNILGNIKENRPKS